MANATVQDHIHLDLPTNIGEGPENAPLQTWTVTEREPLLEGSGEVHRTWDNSTLFYFSPNAQGQPAIFKNMRYTVRVPLERKDAFEALYLQRVLLVDNIHCRNGLDHTPFIRPMIFNELRYRGRIGIHLEYHEYDVTLAAVSPS